MNFFSTNFGALISRSGKTQRELAEKIGISESALVNYKKGRVPKQVELRRICDYFGIPPQKLIYEQFESWLHEIGDATSLVRETTGDPLKQEKLLDELLHWKGRAFQAEKALSDIYQRASSAMQASPSFPAATKKPRL